jgi:5-methylcytosine-specific restriction endonuclease McrA
MDNVSVLKKCPQCDQSFSATIEHFQRHKQTKDGLSCWCKRCFARKQRDYRAGLSPEKLARKKQQDRQWRQANKARRKAQNAARYQANIAKIKQQKSAWYQANKERINAQIARWIDANKEYVNARAAAWKKANPEKHQLAQARRRARKASAPRNDLTAVQWKAIKAHYAYCCVYCGKKSQRLTMDHIIPLSKGGAHTVSNVVPACASCNAKKGTGTPLIPVQPLLLL